MLASVLSQWYHIRSIDVHPLYRLPPDPANPNHYLGPADTNIQVGVKLEFHGPNGRATVFFGNKSASSSITGLASSCTASDGVRPLAGPFEASRPQQPRWLTGWLLAFHDIIDRLKSPFRPHHFQSFHQPIPTRHSPRAQGAGSTPTRWPPWWPRSSRSSSSSTRSAATSSTRPPRWTSPSSVPTGPFKLSSFHRSNETETK